LLVQGQPNVVVDKFEHNAHAEGPIADDGDPECP
jgi:hypothetical protein